MTAELGEVQFRDLWRTEKRLETKLGNHQRTHELARMAFAASRIRFDGLLTPNLSSTHITNALILAPVIADLSFYCDWYLFFK